MKSHHLNSNDFNYSMSPQGQVHNPVSTVEENTTTLNSTALDYPYYCSDFPAFEHQFNQDNTTSGFSKYLDSSELTFLSIPQDAYNEFSDFHFIPPDANFFSQPNGKTETEKLVEYFRSPIQKPALPFGNLLPSNFISISQEDQINFSQQNDPDSPPAVDSASTQQNNNDLSKTYPIKTNYTFPLFDYCADLKLPPLPPVAPQQQQASLVEPLNKAKILSPSVTKLTSLINSLPSLGFSSFDDNGNYNMGNMLQSPQSKRSYIKKDHTKDDSVAYEKRKKHNSLERERRKEVSVKFTVLKNLLTSINQEFSRGSKAATLARAKIEIQRMKGTIDAMIAESKINARRRLQLINEVEQSIAAIKQTENLLL